MAASGPRPRDADALRWLMAEECRRRGVMWPEPYAAPAAAPPLIAAEAAGIRYGSDALAPPASAPEQRAEPAPAGKPKRSRR